MIIKIMSDFLMWLTKELIIAERGKEFYMSFKEETNIYLKEIIPEVPNIGDSIFKSSYLMGVFYIAWYKAFVKLGLNSDEANKWIWKATENALQKIPTPFINTAKKFYLGSMLNKAESHSKKSMAGILPEYDWNISYLKIDDNSFRLDTYQCGIQKLCKKFGTEEMLPSICRMDYLTAHYLRHDFVRTKTLGDGDELCDNKFSFIGSCEWSPEKGFDYRK